jgi:hypothetical protein
MTRFQFILLVQLFCLAAARADLVLEQRSGETNRTYHATLILHGDKMRMEEHINNRPGFGVIVDLITRDSITLMPVEKMFMKRSGAEVQQQMEADRKASGGTNELLRAPAPAADTGKSEKIGTYDTEIYTWSGANGLTETLWVAKDFPDYAGIRAELAKLDKFNTSGPHPNAQPELSALPGMVVKTEKALKDRKSTVSLVSVKLGSVDPALFEMPADYTPWHPPAPSQTNNPPAMTNK